MNKKLFYLCMALMAMLCVPSSAQEGFHEQTTVFKLVNNGEAINEWPENYEDFSYISIYSEGNEIAREQLLKKYYDSEKITSTATITLDKKYSGKTLYYETKGGLSGDFVVGGEDVLLEVKRVIVQTTYAGGEPYIYEYGVYLLDGSNSNGYDSSFIYYVKPGIHTWKWNYGEETVNVTEDMTITLRSTQEKKYRVSVTGRCGNAPVHKGYYLFRLYDSGSWVKSDRSDEATSTSPYCIVDQSGWNSTPFSVKNDTAIVLDYHKVTFNVGVLNKGIRVSYKNQLGRSDYQSYSEYVTTDADGKAEIYLMDGIYKYTMDGQVREFTVVNEDQTINIETVRVTFKVTCDDLSKVGFFLDGQYDTGYMGYEVRPSDDGTIVYDCMPDTEVKLMVMDNNSIQSRMVVVADANKTVDVKLHALKFTSNNTEGEKPVVRSENDSFTVSFIASWNTTYYLIEGDYRYQIGVEYTSFTLDKDMTIEKNYSELTVTVKDTDGKLVSGAWIYLKYVGGSSTNENGICTFYCLPGNYIIEFNDRNIGEVPIASQEVTVNGDTQATLIIPAEITFTIVGIDGGEKLYKSFYICDKSGNSITSFYISDYQDGQVKARLFSTEKYRLKGYQGNINITDGCTITVGTLSVTCEGMGLVFPMENWDAVSTYNVIVGAPVRLAAVSVGNEEFEKWIVDGKEYTEPIMEFKTTERNTVAKAVFGGTDHNGVRTIQSNTSLSFDDQYITLPGEMEGTARIFTLDGKKVKQMGIVGDQIGIYDLPAGAYVLSFKHDGGVINSQFLKK